MFQSADGGQFEGQHDAAAAAADDDDEELLFPSVDMADTHTHSHTAATAADVSVSSQVYPNRLSVKPLLTSVHLLMSHLKMIQNVMKRF